MVLLLAAATYHFYYYQQQKEQQQQQGEKNPSHFYSYLSSLLLSSQDQEDPIEVVYYCSAEISDFYSMPPELYSIMNAPTNAQSTQSTQSRSRIRQRQDSSSSSSSSIEEDIIVSPERPSSTIRSASSSIRQEYIDAVFGTDFFPLSAKNTNYEPPRQGMGLAQIPSFVTYPATIPPPPVPFGGVHVPLEQGREPKLGMTLSKLSLGLYVCGLDSHSEAALAGIQPGSILLSINGMGMLVEPSRHALERLWQYEGIFDHTNTEEEEVASNSSHGSSNKSNTQPHSTTTTNTNNNNPQRPKMQDPIALTFLKDGTIYTATLVAKYWGIQWASCGNFCLVNRAYSYASSIGGVRRGSIIASVNGTSLRESDDYIKVGETMRQVFQARQQSLHLWLVYTPAAGRTGYWERRQQQLQSGGDKKDVNTTTTNKNNRAPVTPIPPKKKTQKRNGVVVRVHSFEESWHSLWGNKNYPIVTQNNANAPVRCGPIAKAWSTVTGRNNNTSDAQSPTDHPAGDDLTGSVAELAHRVVEGDIPAPTSGKNLTTTPLPHWSRKQRVFGPCPPLPKAQLFRIWDPLQAFLFCLQSYQHLLELSSTAHNPTTAMPSTSSAIVHSQLLSDAEITCLLKKLATEEMIQTFLWQFISLIAAYQSKPNTDKKATLASTANVAAPAAQDSLWTTEEKKDEGQDNSSTPSLKAIPSTTTRNHLAPGNDYNYGEVLTSLLLKLSRKDPDFCQRLYFCLRSTLKSLDLETETTGQASPELPPVKPQPENHLLALFNCLQLLRSAEREALDVSGSHLGNIMSVEQQWLNTSAITTDTNTTAANNNSNSFLSTATEEVDTTSLDVSQWSLTSSQKSKQRRLFGKTFPSFRKKKKNQKKQNKLQPPAALVSESAPLSPKRKSQPLSPRRMLSSNSTSNPTPAPPSSFLTNAISTTPLLENMSEFVKELDGICTSIEKRLLKSISQKIADWALQPWSASKSTVLHTLTEGMRQSLHGHNSGGGASRTTPKLFCLVNPLSSQELLVGVDPEECYILPSAHFPLLLTFDAMERPQPQTTSTSQLLPNPSLLQQGPERSYRIVVEICNLSSSASRLVLHGAIGGVIQESVSTLQLARGGQPSHVFRQKLQFDARSSWGAPRTLSVRLSSAPDDDESGHLEEPTDGGFGWIDLIPLWDRLERFQERESYCTAKIYAMGDHGFDEQGGFLPACSDSNGKRLRPTRLECKVTTEVFDNRLGRNAETQQQQQAQQPTPPLHKRMLLYKHDDDLRQEAFAIQFVKTCDTILKASGLDLKLLTFGCIPVGANRGFIEWVEGSVPLSDICQRPYSFFGTTASTATASNSDKEDESESGNDDDDNEDDMSMIAKAGMTNYESLYRMGMAGVGNAAATAMKNTRSSARQQLGPRGSLANNPIQDFLRSTAFDSEAPYFVKREVMDTYVKSCAGYCVITYLLGVGDRHLDNLLLHNQTGCFFHCDYSFLFGNDPKKYLPMRVTEDMIYGMGGRESDNYAKFLSLTGCAFVTLRQPENVRLLLSLVRVMEAARLPDLLVSDSVADAVFGLRQRLRLDLTEEQAVAFMEEMIEQNISSKLWMAVDAIHSLGKRF